MTLMKGGVTCKELSFSHAIRVIALSSREHPADSALRTELRKGNIPEEMMRDVSHIVFSYFRWFGWLRKADSLPVQARKAVQLAASFAADPGSFPDSELMSRAIQPWVRGEVDASAEWVRSLQAEPRLWLRARHNRGATVAARLRRCAIAGPSQLSDTLEYLGQVDLFRTSEFQAGEFEIQDLGSQVVGLACDPKPGETWWDTCAGEGGKTLHLSSLMRNKGLIWASDPAEWRLRILRRRAARAQVFNFRTAIWNGGRPLPTKTRFDGVLIDAPCSGIGTWQRNPHARWTLAPADLKELSSLQLKLLLNAAEALKPSGKLVYAVCTLSRAETVDIAKAFESASPDWERLPLSNPLQPSAKPLSEIWLWPQDYGGNGMFICAWRHCARG